MEPMAVRMVVGRLAARIAVGESGSLVGAGRLLPWVVRAGWSGVDSGVGGRLAVGMVSLRRVAFGAGMCLCFSAGGALGTVVVPGIRTSVGMVDLMVICSAWVRSMILGC